MKRILALREKSILNNGIFGLIWIILGFIQFFDDNTILKLVAIAIMLLSSIGLSIPFLVKTEPEDEMWEYNKNRARSSVYTILSLGISICGLIYVFREEWIINFKIILPFLLGGVNLLEFIFVIIYEKAGD